MKNALKLGAVLFLIAGVSTGLLGMVNEITTPIIKENNEKTQQSAMRSLLSNATEFVGVEDGAKDMVVATYIAKNDTEHVGYIVKVSPIGYGGNIEILVGIDGKMEVQGIQILSHAETPGFGANATKENFLSQFVKRKAPLVVTKMAPGENEVQAITGATITTNAVTEGVNAAVAFVSENKEGWGDL